MKRTFALFALVGCISGCVMLPSTHSATTVFGEQQLRINNSLFTGTPKMLGTIVPKGDVMYLTADSTVILVAVDENIKSECKWGYSVYRYRHWRWDRVETFCYWPQCTVKFCSADAIAISVTVVALQQTEERIYRWDAVHGEWKSTLTIL